MLRVRHCLQCPKCLTRYVISLTPYRNGAYVIPAVSAGCEEYVLYCCCSHPSVPCRYRSNDVMLCHVAKAAYDRGYGTEREITAVDRRLRDRWEMDVGKYLNQWTSPRKNSI